MAKVLKNPLTVEEMRQMSEGKPSSKLPRTRPGKLSDTGGYISGVVEVVLDEVIGLDLDGFLDLLSNRLTGTELLMDISYQVVGHDGDTLHIEVRGDASGVLEYE